MTACLVLTSPEGVDVAGLAARSTPILSKEQASTEKHKLREHCFPPLLLPNSVNFEQAWPQILWETLNSNELEGCNLAILWKTQILCWETGRVKGKHQAPSCESSIIREWMRGKKNWSAFYPVCCVPSHTNKNTSQRVELSSDGHMK